MFSSDGRWAAALSPVSDVALYALPGGELLDRVGGYAPGLRSVAVSPDGSSVATGTVEGVKLWAVATADTASKPIRRWSLLAEPCALTSFGPDGRQLAASQRSAVWVGDVGRKTKGRALSAGKKHAITALAWRQNGSQIATGGRDALVRVWDSATAKQLRALKKHKKAIVCMASSPDGRHLVSAGGDKTLCVWDWTAGKPLKQHKIAADALCYDPTGRWLACASGGKVSLVNALSGKEVRGLADLGAPISCLAISSDGRRIACGDRGGKVSVLDVETGKAVQEIREHRMPVTHVSFSRGEPMILASRSRDGAVCIMKAGLEDQGQGRRGAGEIAWLTDLFGAAESRPAAVVDLDPSQVKTDGSSRVWEQRSSDADGPPDCLGGSQLRWSAKEPGDRIRFCVNLAQAGKYLVGARITRLADGGTFEVMASDQKVGVSCDTVLSKVRGRVLHATETVRIGPCTLTRGENELKLTVAGSPRASTGYAFSIDAIVLWQEH